MNLSARRGDIHNFTGYADYVNHFANPGDPSTFESNPAYAREYMQLFGMMPMKGHKAADDTQYHTYQFPKSQEGESRFIMEIIDGLTSSIGLKFINSSQYGIPIVRTDQLNHHWRRTNFARALMDKVQEEGPARIVRAYGSSGSATSQRYAIALYVEQGWYWTPKGKIHMARSLIQLSMSEEMTIQLQTLLAVVASRVKIYDYEISNNMIPDLYDIRRLIRRKADTFARFQKFEDGAFNAFMDAKGQLQLRGKSPNAIWIPYGSKLWLRGGSSQELDYMEATDSQISRSRQDPETLGSFMGIKVCEIEDFSYEQSKGLPFNPLRGEQAFGQYVTLFGPDPNTIDPRTYRTSDRNIEMFDYARDREVPITLKDCLDHCYVFENPNDPSQDFAPGFHNGSKYTDGGNGIGQFIRNAKPLTIVKGGNTYNADIFGCTEPYTPGSVMGKDNIRFTNMMGEIDRKYLKVDVLKAMAEKILINHGGAVERAITALAPYNFDGFFKKTDTSNMEVIRDVVSILFSNVKDVKMIPVVYGASIYSKLNRDEKEEQIQGNYVSGVRKDEDGVRYLGKPGELVKAYPTPVSDPYGISQSARQYVKNIKDPQNVFNVIDSHGNAYPSVNSNLLTQWMFMRAMLIEEAKDDLVTRRKDVVRIIPTSKKLVNTHKYNVYEEEYSHNMDIDEEKEEKMEFDTVSTGHNLGGAAPEIDHTKNVFESYDPSTGTKIWKDMENRAISKLQETAPSAIDTFKKVATHSNNKEFKMLFGKTFNALLDNNVDQAITWAENLNDVKATKGKDEFGKFLKESHYKFADHRVEPIPSFTQVKRAPTASAVVTPITSTGANVKTTISKRYNVLRQPHQDEFIDHDDSLDLTPAENKKYTATIGVFNTEFLSKQIATGARLIPLDKAYKPAKSYEDAMLNDENPSHDSEIANAHENLKSFSVELKEDGITSTGANVRRSDAGSKSIFNPGKFKDMEIDLIGQIAKQSPTFLIWTALSGRSEEEDKTQFNVKSGTLNNFIVNGPTFSFNPADDTKRIENALDTVKKLAGEAKEPLDLKELKKIRTLRNPILEQDALTEEYVKFMMNDAATSTPVILTLLRRDVILKYRNDACSPSHFITALKSVVDNEIHESRMYPDVREHIENISTFCLLWEEVVAGINATMAHFMAADNNDNTERILHAIIQNALLKHSSNDKALKIFRNVFLMPELQQNGAIQLGLPVFSRGSTAAQINAATVVYNGYSVARRARVLFSIEPLENVNVWSGVLDAHLDTVEVGSMDSASKFLYDTVAGTYSVIQDLKGTDSTMGNSSLTSSGLLKVATKHGLTLQGVDPALPIPFGTVESFDSLHGSVRAVALKEKSDIETTLDGVVRNVKANPYVTFTVNDITYAKEILSYFIRFSMPLRPRLAAAVNTTASNAVFADAVFANNIENIRMLYTAVLNGTRTIGNTAIVAQTIAEMLANNNIIPAAGLVAVNGRPDPSDMITTLIPVTGADRPLVANIPNLEVRRQILEKFRIGAFVGAAPFAGALAYAFDSDYLIPSIGVLEGVYFPVDQMNFDTAWTFANAELAPSLLNIEDELLIISKFIYYKLANTFGEGNYTAVESTVKLLYFLSSNHSSAIKELYIRKFASVLHGLKHMTGFEGHKVFSRDVNENVHNTLEPFVEFEGVKRYLNRLLQTTYLAGNDQRNAILLDIAAGGAIPALGALQVRYNNLENEWNVANVNVDYHNVLKFMYGTVELFENLYADNIKQGRDGMAGANRNGLTLLPYSVAEPTMSNLKDSLMEKYIQTKIHNNVSVNNYANAMERGFLITPERLENFDRDKNVGELLDDLIFDSDVFCCNSKKTGISFALQNNTRFYVDLLGCMKREIKTEYKSDYDIIYSNELYAEIGKKVMTLMESHKEGRDIIVQYSRIAYGSASLATKLLIASMFEFNNFGIELRKLLGKYSIFRKCFGEFVRKMKEYFIKPNVPFNYYNTDAGRIAVLSSPGAGYNVSHLRLGFDALSNGNNADHVNHIAELPWFIRPGYVEPAETLRGTSARQMHLFTVKRGGNNNESTVLYTHVLNIVLKVKNVTVLPLLVKDYYLIVSIQKRQEFVTKLRTEYYTEIFSTMLSKIHKIGADDYRYSELEYYISQSKSIIDADTRRVFIRLLFCRPSRGFLDYLLQSNIPFPFGFIVFRHGITVRKADAIMGDWGNGAVGQFALGTPNTMFQNDAIIKSYYLHHHRYMCAMVFAPENLYAMDDLWMEGFIGGHNSIFYQLKDLKKMYTNQFRLVSRFDRRDDTRPSLITALTVYNDDRLDDIIDIRGKFPSQLDDAENEDYHFHTTRAFYDITGFDKAPTGKRAGAPGKPDTNFVCIRTHQNIFDPMLKRWSTIPGQCFIGDRHYTNMVKENLGYPTNRNVNVLRRIDYNNKGMAAITVSARG